MSPRLFVKHTKTGNPLIDSVAEHQPASPGAYFQYLHDVCYIAPIGIILVALKSMNDSSSLYWCMEQWPTFSVIAWFNLFC
jgi:dolichyl-diphosphooligosaccharide--protein glycosyltransferase